MSAPSNSGLSVALLLRVIDVKYGCFAFFARRGWPIFNINTKLATVKKFFNFFCVHTEWKKTPLIIFSYVSESPGIHYVILVIVFVVKKTMWSALREIICKLN